LSIVWYSRTILLAIDEGLEEVQCPGNGMITLDSRARENGMERGLDCSSVV
jgi:hypothetical protein